MVTTQGQATGFHAAYVSAQELTMLKIISVDPGFGNIKIVLVGSDEIQVVVIPSVVGVGQLDLGLLSASNLGRRQRQAKPDRVTFGISYLASENVARFARPVQRMDFLRL